MQTSLLSAGQNPGASAATVAGNGTPSDLFTKLLVAQIRNQNPLEPTDPGQFVNQLTQLSQMESLQQLASQASANASMLQSMQVLALGAQVGAQVAVQSERVNLAGQPVQAGFTLQNDSARVALLLTGADGAEHRLELGSRRAGAVDFAIDPRSLGLAPGSYALRVDAANKETPAVEIAGELSSVRFSPTAGVVLGVANVGEVLPAAITQFNGRQTASAN